MSPPTVSAERPSHDRWRPHPWHGLSPGTDPPGLVRAFIEITPFDPVKYEIDPESGYLMVDRPQSSSSLPPSAYGFIPRTFCGRRVVALSPGARRGDDEALDICVLSERSPQRAEVLLDARVVGGIRFLDRGDVDDKIIAVMPEDAIWGSADDLDDIPRSLIERLQHYFATYKATGPEDINPTVVRDLYGSKQAERVVSAAMEDYRDAFEE